VRLSIFVPLLATAATPALAGPIAYGICQAGCATLAVACYSAAGYTFGLVAAIMAPAAILVCNAAQGTCVVVASASGP